MLFISDHRIIRNAIIIGNKFKQVFFINEEEG